MRINFSGELIQNPKRCALSSLVFRTLRDPQSLFLLIKLRWRCYLKITDQMKSWTLLPWFVMIILQWSVYCFHCIYCIQFFLSDLIARAPLRQPHIPVLVTFTVFVETISSNLIFYLLLWLFLVNKFYRCFELMSRLELVIDSPSMAVSLQAWQKEGRKEMNELYLWLV